MNSQGDAAYIMTSITELRLMVSDMRSKHFNTKISYETNRKMGISRLVTIADVISYLRYTSCSIMTAKQLLKSYNLTMRVIIITIDVGRIVAEL